MVPMDTHDPLYSSSSSRLRSLYHVPVRSSCALLALALGGCGDSQVVDPLVVLVSMDTVRADHTSVYGYERDTTPFLEELATDGWVFEEAYSPTSWTLTAHATMLSGLQPDEHGIVLENRAFAPDLPVLAEVLSDAGVACAGFYYPSWVHPRFGMDRGFEPFVKHRDAEGARTHVEEWLDTGGGEGPTFLFVHLFDAHSAEFRPDEPLLYAPPTPYRTMYDEEAPNLFSPGQPAQFWNMQARPDPRQLEALVSLYDGGVRYVDDWLGWLQGQFEDRGLSDRVTWLVTADHGEALGDRMFLNDHGGMRPEGLRVPLVIRPAGGVSPVRSTGLASLADLAPTIAGAFGLRGQGPEARGAVGSGIDLLRFERGADEPLRTEKGSQRGAVAPPMMGAAPQRWYEMAADGQSLQRARQGGWWVDLDLDRRGETELVTSHGDLERFSSGFNLLQELREQSLAYRLEGLPDPVPVREATAEEREFLEALGYANTAQEASGGH